MKKIIILLSAILGLALLGFVILLLNINPIINKLEPQIKSLLADTIGHPVSYDTIDVSLFPSTKLSLSNFSLEGSQENKIGTLSLKTSLVDLLKGRLNIQKLLVSDAQISLLRDKNRDLLIGPVVIGKSRRRAENINYSVRTVSQTSSSNDQKEIKLLVSSVELQNVSVAFRDESKKPVAVVTLKNIEGSLEDIAPQREGRIDIEASVLSKVEKNLSIRGSINLGSGPMGLPEIDIKLQARDLELNDTQQLAKSFGAKLPSEIALNKTLAIKLRLEINKNGILLSSEGIDASLASLNYAKFFSKPSDTPLVVKFKASPYLNGSIASSETTIKLGSNLIDLPFSFNPKNGVEINLSSDKVDLANLSTMLPPLVNYTPSGTIVPNLKIKLPRRRPLQLTGDVTLKNVAARYQQKNSGLELSELSGLVKFATTQLSSNNLSFKLADQKFTSTLEIKNLNLPLAKYTLNSESLELDSLLKAFGSNNPKLKGAKFDKFEISGSHASKDKSGFANITFNQGNLAGSNLSKGNLSLDYQLSDNYQLKTARIPPSKVSVFSGIANISGNLSGTQTKLSISASNMQLQQLSAALNASSSLQLIGLLDSAKLQTSFRIDNPLGSVNGSFVASAKDGELQGFNLLAQTLGKLDSIPGVDGQLKEYFPPEYAELLTSDSTKFETLSINTELRAQNAKIISLQLSHPLYQLHANGVAGFNGSCDLSAKLKLTPELTEKMILEEPKLELLLDQQRNLVVPVLIKKKDQIIILPDVSDLGKRALKNSAKEAISKELDRVTPGLGQALEGIFK